LATAVKRLLHEFEGPICRRAALPPPVVGCAKVNWRSARAAALAGQSLSHLQNECLRWSEATDRSDFDPAASATPGLEEAFRPVGYRMARVKRWGMHGRERTTNSTTESIAVPAIPDD
jgi:hypothetical protein